MLIPLPSYASQLGVGIVKIAAISDTVQQSGPPVVSASIGSPINVAGVQSSAGTAEMLSNFNSLVNLPGAPSGGLVFSSPSAAVSSITQYMQTSAQYFAPTIAKLMVSGVLKGAKLATFNYSAPVTIVSNGQSTPGFVNDTCIIQPNAQYQCIGASYNSKVQKIIYATYQQGAVAQGLPQSWTLPNPGVLKWALLEVQSSGSSSSSNFVSVGGSIWHSVNLLKQGGPLGQYGLFDMYQSGTLSNQPVLINCGASSNGTSCTQYEAGAYISDPSNVNNGSGLSYSQKDPVTALAQQYINPLISQYGATIGILLYGETVQPVYNQQSCQTVNGQQVCKEYADTAIYISQRVLINGSGSFFFIFLNGGSNKFNEQGQYGYMLNETVQQYSIDPPTTKGGSVTIHLLNTYQQHEISPSKSFSKSVTLQNGQTISSTDVINPFPSGNQIYSWQNDTVNNLPPSAYVYVAPLTTN